jgi:hypothetical protein
MSVDPSKLRKLGRRGLGTPPTDGSPGIEGSDAQHADESGAAQSVIPDDASAEHRPVARPKFTESAPLLPPPAPEPEAMSGQNDRAKISDAESIKADPEADDDSDAAPPRGKAVVTRGRDEQSVVVRHRVPPPREEPRLPFTSRIAASTKERLEDACYHLRIKHQHFVDEAIRAHLKKHGF